MSSLSPADDLVSRFDECIWSAGLLTSRTDSNGNTRTYAYADQDGDSVADELVSITDEPGRTATFAYTGGKVSQGRKRVRVRRRKPEDSCE